MSRSTCPHLQTIVQINPAELCIQKKVKSRSKEALHGIPKEKNYCIIAKNTIEGNNNVRRTEEEKMFIQFALVDGQKIVHHHRKTMKVIFSVSFRGIFAATAPSLDRISGYV
jgi:hypothetical protein